MPKGRQYNINLITNRQIVIRRHNHDKMSEDWLKKISPEFSVQHGSLESGRLIDRFGHADHARTNSVQINNE